jgi:hypothetical protein
VDKRLSRWIAGGALVVIIAGATGGGLAAGSTATGRVRCGFNTTRSNGDLKVVGLTSDQHLICFKSNNPRNTRTIGPVKGLVGDTAMVGIDFRAANGVLYGVGDAGGIYTISVRTARATKVSQLSVALDGTSFGVDFNPAADRLRIISDTGQNLRHDVTTPAGPTLVDGTLSYPPVAPPALGVTGAAYTNNDQNLDTVTTLFDLDSMMDQVATQSPANSGQLAPTGKLGVDATAEVSVEIYTDVRGNSAVANYGFATLREASGLRTGFYILDPLTGRARLVDGFRSMDRVIAISTPLNQW